MANAVWKGHITFGLISIPVRLFAAARTERISLNQIHKVCNSRIRQPLFCPTCNRSVERSEIVKGYEYEKDQYVLFNENELKKIEPPSAHTMEILEFVKVDEVDPVYLDASYYITPEEAGKKAYYLLLEAMQESGHAAIAKLSMHQREETVMLRPRSDGLMLHTLFYADEVRAVAEYGKPDHTQLKESEKKLAVQLIDSLAAHFDPRKFHDEYREKMRELIAAKLKGQEVAEAPHPQLAPVIDLMDALKKSLAAKPAAHAGAAASAAPSSAPPRPAVVQGKRRKKSAM